MAHRFTNAQQTSLDRKGNYPNYYKARKLYEAGKCGFCIDNGLNPDDNEIEYETAHWVIWEAPARLRPKAHQNGLDRHLMLVPKRHFENFFHMKWGEWLSLWKMLRWVKKKFTLKDFFMFCRSGDPLSTGATELHFSFQIKVANRLKPDRQRMVEVISKTVAEEEDNIARGKRFASLYEFGITPDEFNHMLITKVITKDGFWNN